MMFKIIDCSQRIEANWNWDTTTFISQAYKNNDQFQEFGLKWFGNGFTYITTPKWIDTNLKNLDDYDLSLFCGSAIILNFSNEKIDANTLKEKLSNINLSNINICII